MSDTLPAAAQPVEDLPEREFPERELPEREFMEYDVVIVGAGPAGLSAAIRLKQLAAESDTDVSVTVLEKGSEVGAHILSGAVIDPVGLEALLPDWRERGAPLNAPVSEDIFYYLGPAGGVRIPGFVMPPLMNNHGMHVVSLGNLCRWLAEQAEAMGVEIYPGFAAAEIVYGEEGSVRGVATGDMGVGRDGTPKDSFMRGMELRGKYVLIGEGVRGSLAKQLIAKFGLDADSEPQKYGIGLKELWQVDPAKHSTGKVVHTVGWPLNENGGGGGSFIYHMEDNLVSVGLVVYLNYENPYLSPYEEFQRLKTHPQIRELFEGGKRLSYGARALTQGGLQSLPKLVFPGGALIGCSAGMVNFARIKGTHNAMLSGKLAAEAAFEAIGSGRSNDELSAYEDSFERSAIVEDLKPVRNVKPLSSRLGTLSSVVLGGFDMWCNTLGFSLFGTMKHGKPDHAYLKPADKFKPIDYPKPDGKLTFDRLSSVFLSNTNHEEDQPVHLKVIDEALQVRSELGVYDGPSNRYCPAGVYEWVDDETSGKKRFQINAQNCVHCKTCDIKDPNQNIVWTVPEGAGGPNYPNM